MSFDKHMGKDWRQKFTGAKAVDYTCRNHGTCSYCKSSRTFFDTKYRRAADQEIQDYNDEYFLDESYFNHK